MLRKNDVRVISKLGPVDYKEICNAEYLMYDAGGCLIIDLMTNHISWEELSKVDQMLKSGASILVLPTEESLYPYGKMLRECAEMLEEEFEVDLSIYSRPQVIKRRMREEGLICNFYDYQDEVRTEALKKWFIEHNIYTIIV